jgi:uncharacterized protein
VIPYIALYLPQTRFTAVRVAGLTLPSFADEEKTFAELQERIKATIDMLGEIKREAYEGAETKEFVYRGTNFTGLSYVNIFAVPNFYFHVACAYMILRGKGVDVGKLDYIAGGRDAAPAA